MPKKGEFVPPVMIGFSHDSALELGYCSYDLKVAGCP